MLSYFFIIFLFAIFSVRELSSNGKTTDATLFYFLCAVVSLCFFSSLRWNTGTDFPQYISIYNFIPSITSGENIFYGYKNIEPGYKLLIAVSKLFDSEVVYLFLSCLFSLIPMALGIIKINRVKTIGYFFPLLLYFLIFMLSYNFNAMRQAITMGFFILSLSYMHEKKSYKVFLLSITALAFHSSGILILVSYLLWCFFDLSKNNRFLFVFVPLCLLFYLFNPLLITLEFAGVNVSHWTDKWGELDLISILLRVVILFIICFPYKFFDKHKFFSLLFNLYSHGILIYLALSPVGMMATRFNMFFRVLEIIIIPMIIYSMRYKYNKLFLTIVYLVVSCFTFYQSLTSEVNFYNLRQF